jgi:hypothetical protein
MFELGLTVYIIVATYYMVGIIYSFKELEEKDALLRRFMKKCPPAKIFAMLLIALIAYMWPIGAILQPVISSWVKKTFKNNLPIQNVTNVAFINTPVD